MCCFWRYLSCFFLSILHCFSSFFFSFIDITYLIRPCNDKIHNCSTRNWDLQGSSSFSGTDIQFLCTRDALQISLYLVELISLILSAYVYCSQSGFFLFQNYFMYDGFVDKCLLLFVLPRTRLFVEDMHN